MDATNLLFILSDQHQQSASGCYGHPLVQTPNIDRLAESGTRFTNAYTPCAICVPARAALATGQYVHQIGYWDNGFPYDGAVKSWGHRLNEEGYQVDSIGKLHFRSPNDDNGFTHEIEPMHVVGELGDPSSSIRDGSVIRNSRSGITESGAGETTYQQYDIRNADNAIQWLSDHANDEKPWVLFLSFVTPHPPFLSPEETYSLYPHDQIKLPPQWRKEDWVRHPAFQYMRRYFSFDEQFDEATIRQLHAAYYGICTFLDTQIGRVLTAFEDKGLKDNTRVIYTSDHGEHLGARGVYGKFTMYEEASAVPFIISGPDVPVGKVVNTPISLIDCYPTVLEAVGCPFNDADETRPGDSLWQIAQDEDRNRTVFAEYHAVASQNAFYMLRDSRYKFVYYVDAPNQLFDLEHDADELTDLIENPNEDSQQIIADFEAQLRHLLDPEAVDRRAKHDQQHLIESLGGIDAIISRGSFMNSPVPGENPVFQSPTKADE
jgi:choline-sulfatase